MSYSGKSPVPADAVVPGQGSTTVAAAWLAYREASAAEGRSLDCAEHGLLQLHALDRVIGTEVGF